MAVTQCAAEAQGRDAEERFATDLRSATSALHSEAERTGIVRDIIRGQATRRGYAVYLRNLWEAYRCLEAALTAPDGTSSLRRLGRPAVWRAPSIAADLDAMCGDGWAQTLPLLDEGASYAARVAEAAAGSGARLAAHAYVRYLGDLNGGQVLAKILGANLGLGPGELNFYAFAEIDEPRKFAAQYRLDLARAAIDSGEASVTLDEAAEAFRCNIALSAAVHAAA